MVSLLNAPEIVRVFGMTCWASLNPEGSSSGRGYLPYWQFLEMATYHAESRTLTFGQHSWEVPVEYEATSE